MYRYLENKPNFEFRERTTAESILVENGRAEGVHLVDRAGETLVRAPLCGRGAGPRRVQTG